jgi:hypothetical protein
LFKEVHIALIISLGYEPKTLIGKASWIELIESWWDKDNHKRRGERENRR